MGSSSPDGAALDSRTPAAGRNRTPTVELPAESERNDMGGLNVSLDALAGAVPLLAGFLFVKIALKFAGVMPVALRYLRPHATFTTLLMSTGLTFGTISSLYGLNAGIIDRAQFSVLVTTVILSAIVPTFIAQRFFSPPVHVLTEEEVGVIEDEEFEPARTTVRTP